MKNEPPIIRPAPRMVAIFFASAGLGLVLATMLSFIASSCGFLYSGLDTFFAVLLTTALCSFITSATALVFRRNHLCFSWRTLFLEVPAIALIAVGSLSWLQTTQHMKIVMSPAPVPSGVCVHRGRSVFFGSYVHFTGPPAAIAQLIQAKGLVEIPNDPEKAGGLLGFSLQQFTKHPWNWWQPTNMVNPRFFYRHHETLAIQGWSEGWWVNGKTNEVYAHTGG